MRAVRPGGAERALHRVRGRARARRLEADAQGAEPDLPADDGGGHPEEGLRRLHGGLAHESEVRAAGLLRAVPRDGLQLRGAADGRGRDLLLLRALRRRSQDDRDGRSFRPSGPQGREQVHLRGRRGRVRDENRIWAWMKEQEIRSGKSVLWDHTFEIAHQNLAAEALIMASVPVGKETHKLKVKNVDKMEVYDFPGEFAQRFDGINKGGGEQASELEKVFQDNKRTVGLRMDEETTPAVVIRARSNVKHLVPGYKFTLQRHFNADGKYLLTSVKHAATCGAGYRSGEEAALTYENEATCIPSAMPYRPRRTTPKPVVQGSQTAVVVGPQGEEIFTDKYGRVKVQFHWDRDGKYNEESSTWLRVGQLAAGRRWGASHWPRIGQEVIVDFLEGDPDQPIIVGTVYNSNQMPPYLGQGPDGKHKNDNKVSGFKSNTTMGGQGFNELRFDDSKDKEQVFIHAEKDLDVRVKNDMRERILNDRHLVIGGEQNGSKRGDYKEKVFRDRFILVKRHHEEKIGGDMKLLVGEGDEGNGNLDTVIKGNRTTTIDGNEDLHVKSGAKTKVDGGLSMTVGGKTQEKTGTDWAHEAGQEIHLKAGMKVVIEAGAAHAQGAWWVRGHQPGGGDDPGHHGPHQQRRLCGKRKWFESRCAQRCLEGQPAGPGGSRRRQDRAEVELTPGTSPTCCRTGSP
ncbi:MAG: type VI secretion system tip protein VgrG [Holophagales bacterium]|nr:type VI secretion system tip protein VgrG [Holophagales bacterium]